MNRNNPKWITGFCPFFLYLTHPFPKTFKIVDYEDELDLLSVVAVTQIDSEGKAHLDFHCNEYGTLLKSIPLEESWDVVSRVRGIQSCKNFLHR